MLDPLRAQIATSQALFAALLESALRAGPVTVEQYCRYLSMQYHLTRGVQAYFFAIAAGSFSMAGVSPVIAHLPSRPGAGGSAPGPGASGRHR